MADSEHSLTAYVSDMLALERHIRIPFEMQLKDEDFNAFGDAKRVVVRLGDISTQHIDALASALKELGGNEASPIKSAVTQLEGLVAGAIDKVRKTKVSKSLRDDYTALSLCTISYTMLYTTANGMGESTVATLALKHLKEYAKVVMDIASAIPEVVIEELRAIDVQVDASTVAASVQATQAAWQATAATN